MLPMFGGSSDNGRLWYSGIAVWARQSCLLVASGTIGVWKVPPTALQAYGLTKDYSLWLNTTVQGLPPTLISDFVSYEEGEGRPWTWP